jgi:hypothetical protein
MTFEEVENATPQGLHDAQIRTSERDFESATVTFFVKLVVGRSRPGKAKAHGGLLRVGHPPTADSSVPLDDVLTALNGSAKNQIDQVPVFIRKNEFFPPLTIGEQSSKDPTK